MLSVIVDAQGAEDRLAGLFAALTPAAVEGLVREVLVAEAVDALCQDMGAEAAGDLVQAVARAKSDWILVLPAAIRFRNGWVERLADHLAAGPSEALLLGDRSGGFLQRRLSGVLVRRSAASGLAALEALRKQVSDRVRLD